MSYFSLRANFAIKICLKKKKKKKNTPIPSSHELSVFSATEHPNFKSESPKFHSLLLAELESFQNKPYHHRLGNTHHRL